MTSSDLYTLKNISGITNLSEVACATESHLEHDGASLTARALRAVTSYNDMGDLVPYFGDHRLPHTEASNQLHVAFCLAFHGFYSQAFSTLRPVLELTLLQAALPPGPVVSQRKRDLFVELFAPQADPLVWETVNLVLPAGFGERQTPHQTAGTIDDWASDGCRSPKWKPLLKQVFKTDVAHELDERLGLSCRVSRLMATLNPFVHTRGRRHTSVGLSKGNVLRFSADSFNRFCEMMLDVVSISLEIYLVRFLPTATFHPEAAAGFLEEGDFLRAMKLVPVPDAEVLGELYEATRSGADENEAHEQGQR